MTGIEEGIAAAAAAAASAASAVGTAVTAGGIGTALSTAGAVAGLAGTGLSALSSIQQGKAQSQTDRLKAAQAIDQGNEAAAVGERDAITKQKAATLLLSRQRALAADSGGGTSDPTVINLEADAGQQGEYNALSAMYSGQARERGLDEQSSLDLTKSTQDTTAGDLSATSSILSGISTFGNRFAKFKYPT